MKRKSKIEVTGTQGAFGTFRMFRLIKSFLVIVIGLIIYANSVSAQHYYVPRQQPPGYYYLGSQQQAFQTNGTRIDSRGFINGGVNIGPVGVQGFNYGHTYSYPQQQTVSRNVPQFYYDNGSSCNARIYSYYQLPNGANIYYPNGNPYQGQMNQYFGTSNIRR